MAIAQVVRRRFAILPKVQQVVTPIGVEPLHSDGAIMRRLLVFLMLAAMLLPLSATRAQDRESPPGKQSSSMSRWSTCARVPDPTGRS